MTDTLVKPAPNTSTRTPTQSVQVFIRDPESAETVRQSLGALGLHGAEFINGSIENAITLLAQQGSPQLLIVDVSRVDDPISRVHELANVCAPNTGVIVVGDRNDITLYRRLKHSGIVEYFFKPLVGDLITRTCNSILTGTVNADNVRGGKLVFVLGVRGGVGATTIAVNTSWFLSEKRQRGVLLLDLDLQHGDAALQLGVTPSHALREAFEHPERVDKLFLERAVIPVEQRIDLLAALETLGSSIGFEESAVLSLLDNLLQRYRYVFVDVPADVAVRLGHMLHLPSVCLLVSSGTLVSAREVARWRELIGPNSHDRTMLHILNQQGAPGSLPAAEFLRAAGQAPDVVIPYDREFGTASILGIKATQKSSLLKRSLAPVLRHLSGDRAERPHSVFSRIFG